MDAKEYLTSYRTIQERHNILLKEINRLTEEAASVSVNLDGMPKGGQTSDKTARLAVQIADMTSKMKEEMDDLLRRRMKIIHQLRQVKNHKHQTLLHKRYIECKTWERIAYEMDISWRYCYQLHGSALAEFSEIMKKS